MAPVPIKVNTDIFTQIQTFLSKEVNIINEIYLSKNQLLWYK